ncbi:unnamed protein product [Durusdinium trenchii]|uniref:Uncharacterized protein n=2 Tax=Durusdinium trenchii TaxID=1381693 RepID=A0ABP0KC45_9DINO
MGCGSSTTKEATLTTDGVLPEAAETAEPAAGASEAAEAAVEVHAMQSEAVASQERVEEPLHPCAVPEEASPRPPQEASGASPNLPVAPEAPQAIHPGVATKVAPPLPPAQVESSSAEVTGAQGHPPPQPEVPPEVVDATEEVCGGGFGVADVPPTEKGYTICGGHGQAEEDEIARSAASMAIAECLQRAEVAAQGYHREVLVQEAQALAAQHVESWTASVLLLQHALAEAGLESDLRLPVGKTIHEEEVHCPDDQLAPLEGTKEFLELIKPGEEERPSTANTRHDDLLSTCDGSRRDPESRCDLWEGSERPGSSDQRPGSSGGAAAMGTLGMPMAPLGPMVPPLEEAPHVEKQIEVPGCAARAMSPPDYPPPELLEQRKAALRAAKLVEAEVSEAIRAVTKGYAARRVEVSHRPYLESQSAAELVASCTQQAVQKEVTLTPEQLQILQVEAEAAGSEATAAEAATAAEEAEDATEWMRLEAARIEADALKALRLQEASARSNADKVEDGSPSLEEATRMRIEAEEIEAEIKRSVEQQGRYEDFEAELVDPVLEAHFAAVRQSEAERMEALHALEASRAAVRKAERHQAEVDMAEQARREAQEAARFQEEQAKLQRQHDAQRQAEALHALDVTRQVGRQSDADAKAKWEKMKAQAAEAEREVKEAADQWNRQAEKAQEEALRKAEKADKDKEVEKASRPDPERAKDELERVQAEADHLLAAAQKAQARAEEEAQKAQEMQREADQAEAKARAAQMHALQCREQLRRSQKEIDDAERARCEAVLAQIRWRVEARRLELEEELFSQATLDADRPDQRDSLGAFPPVINHARANLDFALTRVRTKMEQHGIRRQPAEKTEAREIKAPPASPCTYEQMVVRMRHSWDQRLKVLEGQGRTRGSPRP